MGQSGGDVLEWEEELEYSEVGARLLSFFLSLTSLGS